VSKTTWPERVRGGWVVVLHRRGSGLSWGTREVQGGCCTCWFGRRDKEGVGELEVSCLRAARARAKNWGWGVPVGLSGGVAGSVGCAYPPGEWGRGERGFGEDLGKILMHAWLKFLLSPSFSQNFEQWHGWGISWCSTGHLAWHSLLDFCGVGLALKRKEISNHIK
jgi:hypothetical protein